MDPTSPFYKESISTSSLRLTPNPYLRINSSSSSSPLGYRNRRVNSDLDSSNSLRKALSTNYKIISPLNARHIGSTTINTATKFQASEVTTQRLVAIWAVPTPSSSSSNDEDAYRRLRRVHLAMDKFSHRNLPSLYGLECVDRYMVLSWKYCALGSAFDVVHNTTDGLSEKRTLDIVKSLLTVVAYLHKNGQAHGDIRLKNMLFTMKERLQLHGMRMRLPDDYTNNNNKRNDNNDSDSDATVSSSNTTTTAAAASTASTSSSTTNCASTATNLRDILVPKQIQFVAPELTHDDVDLTSVSTQQLCTADIWSIGICMYIMLTRSLNSKKLTPLSSLSRLKHHSHCVELFMHPKLHTISDKSTMLLQGMLQIDPAKRLSADEALLLCSKSKAFLKLSRPLFKKKRDVLQV